MEQHTLKNLNNCLNNNIYSYLETSGGYNLYLNVEADKQRDEHANRYRYRFWRERDMVK